MSSSGSQPAAVLKDLGGIYTFSYERYMSFTCPAVFLHPRGHGEDA